MASRIMIARPGRADSMTLVKHELTAPGDGEVLLQQHCVGVNFLDITQRNGSVPMPMPSGLGLEGAGVVMAVGPGVAGVAAGDRVAYALGPIGSYADSRLYPADRLVHLPEELGFEEAASLLFKGLTAQYLLTSTYPVTPGCSVLLYGAAGALGQIMAGWATDLGARVIGVVSKEASVARAHAAGCTDVLVWSDALPNQVRQITGVRGVDVVYDGIGKKTFAASLDSLKPRGILVSIGASSGAPDPISVAVLNQKGSLFLTRPGLAAHITDIEEYRLRAREVFDAVRRGAIVPRIAKRYSLSDAVQAHIDLENGMSGGAVILDVR
ncbi:quinone oxidoreductase [Novosphingobium sp. SG707]|uniref:quinone oxidoreductase family protein n=1 Tax=Novosphingobium sp. SG707 TaxID=2586996 RepID=UPI0014470E8E|nr:quinone oxidoreductase [Novosphingobium sp. SG707]NKJ03008.1 NADPH2:quinone reductase [Novosphingobium sp. SG707]